MSRRISPLHVERGRQIRSILEHDVTVRGLSAEAATESLAAFLGISTEAVKLAVAIANSADGSRGSSCPVDQPFGS